jgi:hypothetical protein
MPFSEWVSRFPLCKQRELSEAREKVEGLGVQRGHARVDCFIKNETSVSGTDPRNISPRKPEFLATIGPYVSALEKLSHDCPYLVKGCNIDERDEKLSWLLDFPCFIETDQSRLDMNMDQPIIADFEMQLWAYLYPPAEHPVFHEMIQLCLETTGMTPFGFIYHVMGTRISGDAHTSILNGLWCRFMQWLCNLTIPKREWRSSHEGDDAIMGVSRRYELQVAFNTLLMWCMGFGVKLERYTDLQLSTFCGRRHVPTSIGLVSMCDLRRTLAKFHTTQSGLPGRRAILAKAFSYWSTDSRTPVIGPLCYSILSVLRPDNNDVTHILRSTRLGLYEKERILLGMRRQLSFPTVLADLRAAADIRDGIGVSLQCALESAYLDWGRVGFIPANFPLIEVDELHVDDDRCTYMGPNYPIFRVPSM